AVLLLLVGHVYWTNLRGLLRWAVLGWFVLIGLSPLLVYQHHLVDVIGGAVLAGYCFYFFREQPAPTESTTNCRIGVYYAIGAVVALAALIYSWPAGVLLIWPVVALIIVASAYFGVGPGIFRKNAGIIPWSARFVLGPCLV